jgi:hypothetical protein
VRDASWEECEDSASAVRISPDRVRAGVLAETARARIRFAMAGPVAEDTANFVFENYYTSVLEMLTAVILLGGYKIENHVCAGFYLRDVLKRDNLFRLFDHCRSRRNALVYYGRKADLVSAKESIGKAGLLMKELSAVFERLLGAGPGGRK